MNFSKQCKVEINNDYHGLQFINSLKTSDEFPQQGLVEYFNIEI
jgi:hypothetical protein